MTASLTSTASHLSNGTVSLYNAAGLAFVPGDLLSPRSADKLSGDELYKIKIICIKYNFFVLQILNNYIDCV